MTKATCQKCGKTAHLTEKSPEGTEYWTIKDAMKKLIEKVKEVCICQCQSV